MKYLFRFIFHPRFNYIKNKIYISILNTYTDIIFKLHFNYVIMSTPSVSIFYYIILKLLWEVH